MAGRLTVKGRIYVDAGAARALVSGASLLPAGAARVEGRFVQPFSLANYPLDTQKLPARPWLFHMA